MSKTFRVPLAMCSFLSSLATRWKSGPAHGVSEEASSGWGGGQDPDMLGGQGRGHGERSQVGGGGGGLGLLAPPGGGVPS